MQGDEFEVVMQLVLRQTASVHFLKLAFADKSLAAPYLFGNVAEADRLHLRCTDEAAQALLQIVDFDQVPGFVTAVAVFAVGPVIILNGVGGDSLAARNHRSRQTVVVLVGAPKGQAFASVHTSHP